MAGVERLPVRFAQGRRGGAFDCLMPGYGVRPYTGRDYCVTVTTNGVVLAAEPLPVAVTLRT